MFKNVVLIMTASLLSLAGTPQEARDSQGVEVRTPGLRMLHRGAVEYPAEARARAIGGDVTAALTLDGQGEVVDAKIVSGPPELRAAVLRSVLGWHFALDSAAAGSSTVEVAVHFTPPAETASRTRPVVMPGGDFTVDRIDLSNLPAALRAKVEAAMPVHVGELVPRDRLAEIDRALRSVDSHLLLQSSFRGDKTDLRAGFVVTIDENTGDSVDAGPVRVGGNQQAAKLIQKVTPKYPIEAKQAHIQGMVKMEATIAKDGTIQSLKVLSGPPELTSSALEAVRQWVYRPTLLNGDPVSVITQIDVNYVLAP